MNDEDRHVVWWQLVCGAIITVGATLLAIGFTFSVTGETLESLTDAQKSILRGLFYQYLASGGILILGGIYIGAKKILGWGVKKKD